MELLVSGLTKHSMEEVIIRKSLSLVKANVWCVNLRESAFLRSAYLCYCTLRVKTNYVLK